MVLMRLCRKDLQRRIHLAFFESRRDQFYEAANKPASRHVDRQGEYDFQADPDTFRNQIRQDFFQIHISDFFDRFREFGFLYAVRNDEFFGLLCCDEKKSHERIKFDRLSCKFNQKNRK